ncbi:MAG: hypothetical protein ACOX6V_01245 [Patescibacteria group bacterium]|jgi:hypothetical protein
MLNLKLIAVTAFILSIAIALQNVQNIAKASQNYESSELISPLPVEPVLPSEEAPLDTPSTLEFLEDISKTNPEEPTISSENSLYRFVYPNAQVLQETLTTFSLNTPDSPETVTEWYKKLFAQSEMKAQSTIQTRTNNLVINTLTGANLDYEVGVRIKSDTPGNTDIYVEVINFYKENI